MSEALCNSTTPVSDHDSPVHNVRSKIPRRHLWTIIRLGLAFLFIVTGSVGFKIYPTILRALVKENLSLGEGKEAFEKWKKAPIPVTFKAFLFNITNYKDVMNGSKPHLVETGPYIFRQMRSKDILSWNETLHTVTYRDMKRYYFVPELSANIEEKVYTVNMPLQGIIMFLKKLSPFIRSLIVPALEGVLVKYNETLFSHKTARELLFEGYKVELIKDLVDLASPFVTVPELLPNNTFGYLYGKNNSGDGIFEVFTGRDDITKYTQIFKWNNMSRVPFWNDRYCNMMNGTDGAQFPPPVTKKDVLYAYTPDLCRSVFLEFGEEVKVRGIPAYRFITPDRLFASPFDNPDNMCFCTEPELCELSGILDLSPCRKGIKLTVTGPHFFKTHKYIQETVTGLSPDKDLHDVFVDIEPNTGLVMRASRKLQIGFGLEPFQEMENAKLIARAVVPLVWVVEEAEITEGIANVFNSKVRTPITVAKSVLTACIVLGILWIVTAGFVTVYILMKEQKTAKAVIKSKYKAVPQKPDDILKTTEKSSTVNA